MARSEATAQSDVDVAYCARPDAKLTLFDLALPRDELVVLLGRPVDLVELRDGMPPRLKQPVEEEATYA